MTFFACMTISEVELKLRAHFNQVHSTWEKVCQAKKRSSTILCTYDVRYFANPEKFCAFPIILRPEKFGA